MNVRGLLQAVFSDEEGVSIPSDEHKTMNYDVSVECHTPQGVKKFVVEDANWEHNNERLVIYVEEFMI